MSTTFSEPVQGVTSSSFTLTSAAGAVVPATVAQGPGTTWTLTPNGALATDTRYTVNLTGGPTAIRDLAGNPLAGSSWSFLTGPAPTITTRTPVPGASGVATNGTLSVGFSEVVTGVDGSTFTVTGPGGIVLPGTVSKAGGGATSAGWNLKLNQNLAARTTYTVTVTGGPTAVRDAAGNPLVTSSWTFTTK